jgi:hypothetical protein
MPAFAVVREWVLASAEHWIAEYHLDGLRIDATQSIVDESKHHLLDVLGQRVRAAAGTRQVLIVNENEPQDARLVRPTQCPGVDQRTTRVAGRHSGIGLDEALQRPGLGVERAIERRDDSKGDSRITVEIECVSDCHHLVAEMHVAGRRERCRTESRRIDAQQRQIAQWIGSDHRRLTRLALAG